MMNNDTQNPQANVIWKPIRGFEGIYKINSSGKVRSLNRTIQVKEKSRYIKGRMITSRIGRDGYKTVRLSKAGKTHTRYIHRLIADAFIRNPLNKPFVNHINGDKSDNRVENLEWVSHSENIRHAYVTGLYKIPHARCKRVVNHCTGKHFRSIREAAKKMGISYKTCVNYLNGNRRNPTCLEIEGN